MNTDFEENENTQQKLQNLYVQMTQFVENMDLEKINIFEKDFGMVLMQNLNFMKNKNIKYLCEKVKPEEIQIQPLEILNIFGISPVRYENHPLQKIKLIKNDYRNGVLVYQQDSKYCYLNFNCANNFKSMVRLVAKVYHKPIFTLQKDNKTVSSENEEQNYHLVVFEHSFQVPFQEVMTVIEQGDYQMMAQYAVPGEWKIADIDGFMDGNSIYRSGLNYNIINNQQWIIKFT